MKAAGPAHQRIVLVGGGHAHVGVLRSFAMQPEPGVELLLIAKELDAPYSGMLPGFVAGHYDLDACHIDLVRLAHFANARLVHGEVIGIDRQRRRVAVAGRPALAYTFLSLDVGITPFVDDIQGAERHALAVKPVSTFAPRWQALEARALAPDGPRRIVVVGTGAAGFELILAIRHRLLAEASRRDLDATSFHFTLLGSAGLLATHNATARRLALQALQAADVALLADDRAVAIEADHVRLASGRRIASDATLMSTRAAAPGWFRTSGLPVDAQGFVAVRPTLQLADDDDIFAAGDCAAVSGYPREKAGVFAVRQAPPLARNLRLRTRSRPAEPFVPQRQFLTLLSLGGRSAIAARGSWAASGAWAWRLKDHIDRRFMQRFRELPPPGEATAGPDALLCAGCAAKIGPHTLARALDRLDSTLPPAPVAPGPPSPDARPPVINLAPHDDAAVLDLGSGPLRLETIDAFPAIWPDPYVLGEIVAAHALGDILAKGGRPDHALALAGIPEAAAPLAEDDLFQLLAGMRAVLDRHGVTLVGGHSSRSETLSAGLFVSGTVDRDQLLANSRLAPGDRLVLTKPLGTGILFAAWMRRRARARDIATVLQAMRRAEFDAARILAAHGATAATDVTGFGLAGHLVGMLEASRVIARIALDPLPRYPGVDDLIAAGIRSSLLPENLKLADRLSLDPGIDDAALALLFDPQTSGGLLAGVPTAHLADCLAALKAAGIEASVIGEVMAGPAARPSTPLVIGLHRAAADASPGDAVARVPLDHSAINST